jgi:uncharacterized protein with GYD domain
MMRLVLLLLAAFFSALTAGAVAADVAQIRQRVAELNKQSITFFGVSLNALRYLVDADAGNYLHLGHLEQSGNIKFIRELESKGYVRTQVVKALPDGTQRSETFLQVVPVGEGAEIQRSIVGLQHNTAVQPTR